MGKWLIDYGRSFSNVFVNTDILLGSEHESRNQQASNLSSIKNMAEWFREHQIQVLVVKSSECGFESRS